MLFLLLSCLLLLNPVSSAHQGGGVRGHPHEEESVSLEGIPICEFTVEVFVSTLVTDASMDDQVNITQNINCQAQLKQVRITELI